MAILFDFPCNFEVNQEMTSKLALRPIRITPAYFFGITPKVSIYVWFERKKF